MYCVIQEIELKKPNTKGKPKELQSKYMQMSMNGKDLSHYYYCYSEERFERTIKKSYKISIHISHRENGKVKKKQYPLCTVGYYDIADKWFTIYDYCGKKIELAAKELIIDAETIYDLIQAKTDPLVKLIQSEFSQSEEYRTHAEHERITTLYTSNKAKFNEKYSGNKYDEIYDVFGNLMNQARLDEVEAEYKYRQEYEEKSRSYQEKYYSNYKDSYSGSGSSSYSNYKHSNHDGEDKETLKQFYRVLSKKFHPDSNPDTDTSKQMQLLNQLKDEWGV
jgi:hypothetical protein